MNVRKLLSRMTIEEKVMQLCSLLPADIMTDGRLSPEKMKKRLGKGIGFIASLAGDQPPGQAAEAINEVQRFLCRTRLGIPAIMHQECLHGCMAEGHTIFPQAIGLASAFDPEVVKLVARAIARETRARGHTLALSPVLDLGRDPRCGRTEETYGEDPVLVTEMAVAFVQAMQAQGIGCTPKHFAANFVADGGRDSHDIRLSEHALRELYLRPYEECIRRTNPTAIMPSYNSINGCPNACNAWLLIDVLRKQWGFAGITGSDYWSIDTLHQKQFVAADSAEAARLALINGMDVEWPNSTCYPTLIKQVSNGTVPVSVLNRSVERVLCLKQRLGLFENPFGDPRTAMELSNCAEHRALARETAERTMVLLKNKNLLPLSKKIERVAVIGPNALDAREGGYSGTGVSVATPFQGIREKLGAARVVGVRGCANTGKNGKGLAKAIQAAEQADAVVLCVGNWSGGSWINKPYTEGEGRDRCDLRLPGVQERLITEVAKVNKKTVVVLIGGSAVEVEPWVDDVKAVVNAWYPGCEGGRALADVLFGDVNPSGKLPITFPRRTGQLPYTYDIKPTGRAYDYTDQRGTQERFAFGHGLSYTTFDYRDLKLRKRSAGSGAPLLRVSFTVANTGRRDGEEVAQLYIHDCAASLTRPLKELKRFKRISLSAGETASVEFDLNRRDLSFLGHNLKYMFEPGAFEIMVGSSSADIRLRATITLPGDSRHP